MKIPILKITAATLAASIILLSSACGNEPQKQEPETVQTTVAQDVFAEQTTTDEPESDVTQVADEVTTLATAEPTSTADEVSEPEATEESAAPETTEEIVALFNQSANRIKTEAILVVKNYEKRTVNEEHVSIPKAIEGMTQTMLTTVMKDDVDPIAYSTREEIRTEFIVPDQSYVSRLQASDVVYASCKDTGKNYEIYFKIKDESNPSAGKGVGAVCDVIETYEVEEKAPSFLEEFSTSYYDCEVTATIDKETGRVTHIVYSTPLTLNVVANLFGTQTASVGFTFVKDYTITY